MIKEEHGCRVLNSRGMSTTQFTVVVTLLFWITAFTARDAAVVKRRLKEIEGKLNAMLARGDEAH